MATRRDMSALLDQTAPEPTSTASTEPATGAAPAQTPTPAPQRQARKRSGSSGQGRRRGTWQVSAPRHTQEVTTVRSTLDLPRDQHAELQRFALSASEEMGVSVRPQHLVRALVAEMLNDHQLYRQALRALGSGQ